MANKALGTYFYHKTIERAVVVFGTVFNEMQYLDDHGVMRDVKLYYASRDKFLSVGQDRPDAYSLRAGQTVPRLAYNLTGMAYAPERMTDQRHRVHSADGKLNQFNRVPYNFSFELYLRTNRFGEGLPIIEQIIPLFAPAFNVTANDVDHMGFKNDYTITLDSVGWDDLLMGSYETPREVLWTLGFTMKAYMYNMTAKSNRIKEVISNFTPKDFESQFERYTAEVVPRTAEKEEPHKIVERIEKINPSNDG